MQQTISLRILPHEAADAATVLQYIQQTVGKQVNVTGFYPVKQSIDARGKTTWINLTVLATINEPFIEREIQQMELQNVQAAKHTIHIIGAGPAGLFAALRCIELGIKPVILERGKDVRARRRDLAILNKEGIINPDSNYCFGEGGAGTYSDGKLYTRSNKRGSIDKILNAFVQFGAEEKILYQSHPHIGTNKLPHIITAMREAILDCGGEIYFETKVTAIQKSGDSLTALVTTGNSVIKTEAVILATGHSARDIFTMLHNTNILIEAKPFALGVRAEHPQQLIDSIQYHCNSRSEWLPPASYSLVEQVHGKGVFSFCMCPGGIIATASTSPEELVVNGWSPSKRNNPFANSGMVVQVGVKEAYEWLKKTKQLKENVTEHDPLLLMYFQQVVERSAYAAGGGAFKAPAQRMIDFSEKKHSARLPACSYVPGISSADLETVLPSFIYKSLQDGFKAFGKKMKGYYTNEAVVVATESRTSSPVRIPREEEKLNHPQIKNLFPCGEGAGYAGGIVSAAMDGIKVADAVASMFEAK